MEPIAWQVRRNRVARRPIANALAPLRPRNAVVAETANKEENKKANKTASLFTQLKKGTSKKHNKENKHELSKTLQFTRRARGRIPLWDD
jgi:hypothetical protein